MSKVLDFTKQKKEYLTVKLADEKNTVLMVGMPTKDILTEFINLNDNIDEDDGVDIGSGVIDDLYHVTAKILSFNKGGIHISADYLSSFFDLNDIMVFFNAYMEFVTSISNSKN